jgi:hypothetical protein
MTTANSVTATSAKLVPPGQSRTLQLSQSHACSGKKPPGGGGARVRHPACIDAFNQDQQPPGSRIFFLEPGADVEVRLPAFDMTQFEGGDEVRGGAEMATRIAKAEVVTQ